MDWSEKNDMARQAMANARFTTASGFVRTNCPYCVLVLGKEDRKQCLAISSTTGYYRCWRCHTSGKLDLEDATPVQQAPADVQPIAPPEDFMPLTEEPAASALCADEAREYLRGRGLTDEAVWRAAGLGVCVTGRYGGRVIAPVLDPEGVWQGWVGRAWVKKADKPYTNCPGMSLGARGALYNEAALYAWEDSPVLVVEGVFDALAYWPHAVAVLGKPTDPQLATLAGCARPVVLVLDGDAWEEAWMLAMRLRFDGQRAGYVRLPPRMDPDDMDHAWLREEARRSLEVAL